MIILNDDCLKILNRIKENKLELLDSNDNDKKRQVGGVLFWVAKTSIETKKYIRNQVFP